MDWATILRVGFSGFAFAVLVFGYRVFDKKSGSAKAFAGFGLVLAMLVIASSFIDKWVDAKRPEVVLASCRSSLETLLTHARMADGQSLQHLPGIVEAKVAVCAEALDDLDVK